ncbi:MAG: hypothetical protein R3F65_21205 [bacterium]
MRCKHYDRAEAVTLALTVGADGRVARVELPAPSDRVDAACLRETASHFRFAPFAGAPVTVAVDYRL